MTTEQDALLAAIRTQPDDRTARLVYADWLDENADSLGYYVRCEVEFSSLTPGSRKWESAVLRLHDYCSKANASFGGWEYAPDLARIGGKIDRLRARDARMEIFGAGGTRSGHKYRVEPSLRENELFAFELRHGVALPAEYRAFVLRVGNGRVGPDYGLHPLDLARDYEPLRKPFPIGPEVVPTITAAVKRGQETRNWEEYPQPDEETWGHGHLELCEHGCGNESVLVVNGPLRGQVWWQGDLGLVPGSNAHEPLGFLAWYEEWLDRWLAPGAIEQWASHFRR